jgi:hypothetical protein
MNKSDLTVLTVVENDCGIFDLMIRSLYRFTNPVPNIIICYQGGSDKTMSRYINDPNITIINNKPILSSGSNRHGEGLNKIFPMVSTQKTAIIESDCVILKNGWDCINFPSNKMIAAKKGEIAGQPYYHMCFMVFSTSLLKHGKIIDFRPGKDDTRSNRSYKPYEDVGWRIREKVRPDEIYYIDFKDCKTGEGRFFDKRFQSDELWMNNSPIVSHFGRGSNITGKAIRNGFMHPQQQLIEWKKIAEELIR